MKKNVKKGMGIASAAIVAASLAAPIAANAGTITINGIGSGYEAYKILNLTTDQTNTKFSYSLNTDYEASLRAVIPAAADADNNGTITEAEIVEYIRGLDTDGIKAFSKSLYEKLKADGKTATYETETKNFGTTDQGYYLIAETAIDEDAAKGDAKSLVMLDTLGREDVTVNAKESVPTVTKTITQGAGLTADGEAASYSVGDTASFKLEASLPMHYGDYKVYYLEFNDTMPAGLTRVDDSVKVWYQNGDADPVQITTGIDTGTVNAQKFTVKTGNIKANAAITADTKVFVTYDAKITADLANKSDNAVDLSFTNDPYTTREGDKDTTPEDKATLFTFDLTVNKVDKDGAALAGAGFTLYKMTQLEGEAAADWHAVGTEKTGTTSFDFDNLGEGVYKLVETTVPGGYNKAADVIFKIVPTYTTNAVGTSTLNTLKVMNEAGDAELEGFTITLADGTMATNVVNNTGLELPSTGAAGTVLLFAVGAAAVIGGIVITRKKDDAED